MRKQRQLDDLIGGAFHVALSFVLNKHLHSALALVGGLVPWVASGIAQAGLDDHCRNGLHHDRPRRARAAVPGGRDHHYRACLYY